MFFCVIFEGKKNKITMLSCICIVLFWQQNHSSKRPHTLKSCFSLYILCFFSEKNKITLLSCIFMVFFFIKQADITVYFWGWKFWYHIWYPKNTILGCVGVLTHDIFGKKNTTKAWEQCSFVFFARKHQFFTPKKKILGCVGVFTHGFHSIFVRKKSMRAG